MLLFLLLHESVQQNRIEIFCHGRLIAGGCFFQIFHGNGAADDVQCVEGFLRSPEAVSLFLAPFGTEAGAGVTHVGILQLLRVRLLMDVQYPVAAGDIVAF